MPLVVDPATLMALQLAPFDFLAHTHWRLIVNAIFLKVEKSFFNVEVPLAGNTLLIYNSISKELIKLAEDDTLKYIENNFTDIYYPTWMLMSSRKMLCSNSNKQYKSLVQLDYKSKKLNNEHMSLTLMMSEACNFSCSYCNQGQNKDHVKISNETINYVNDYIKGTSELKKLIISWYGGEPLLAFNEILEFSNMINDVCKSCGVEYSASIITNGFLLTNHRAKELYKVGIHNAQVTIDGSKTFHDRTRYANEQMGSYDIIMKNITDVLNDTEMWVCLRVNVNNDNLDGMDMFISDLSNRGFANKKLSVYFSLIYDPTASLLPDAVDVDASLMKDYKTYAEKELDLLKLLDKHSINVALDIDEHEGDCLLTRSNSIAIDPKGNLFKCYIPISNDEFSVGTVENIRGMKANKIYSAWDSWSPFTQDGCKTCKLLGSCRGGCPLHFVSKSHQNLGYKCPTSKLMFNEHLFRKAYNKGLLDLSDWDESRSPTKLESLIFEQCQ